MKWTKKDINTLNQQLAHWWCFSSMYLRSGKTATEVWDTMPMSVRVTVVIGGLRNFRSLALDHAASNRGMVDHYAGVWPDTGEPRDPDGSMGLRCAESAAECVRSAEKLRRLIERIESDGLPPEVIAWRPDNS